MIPATGLYEWQRIEGARQPFAFVGVDGELIAFAGLWEGFRWPDGSVEWTLRAEVLSTTTDPGRSVGRSVQRRLGLTKSGHSPAWADDGFAPIEIFPWV